MATRRVQAYIYSFLSMMFPSEFQGYPYTFSGSKSKIILQPKSAVWGLSILVFTAVFKEHIVLPQWHRHWKCLWMWWPCWQIYNLLDVETSTAYVWDAGEQRISILIRGLWTTNVSLNTTHFLQVLSLLLQKDDVVWGPHSN